MNKRRAGDEGERIAQMYLEKKGYKIEQVNFRCRTGEIDIVANDHGTLVFVEVKSRSQREYGYPIEAVTANKIQKIERTAVYYQMIHKKYNVPARIDVVEVYKENDSFNLNHIENVTG